MDMCLPLSSLLISTSTLQGVLEILAGLPEHLCDRGALLRRLLAIKRSVPAAEQASSLRKLLQMWLPFGRQPEAFEAWAEFLGQCTDTEACPNMIYGFREQSCLTRFTLRAVDRAICCHKVQRVNCDV